MWTKRVKLHFAVIPALLALLLMASPALAAKEYEAERFDVQVEVQEDGSAIVTETVVFRFAGDPFTFAFREISAGETDGLTFLEASMDGRPLPVGTGAGQVEVEAGDPLKVTWHFPPTANASHEFVVRYLAEGVIRKGDADTLIWRAVPEDHDYPIASSTISLRHPPAATLLEAPSLSQASEVSSSGDAVTLSTGGLGPDDELILTARFAADSVTRSTPRWQARSSQVRAATAQGLPIGLAAGLATLLLGGVGILAHVRANRRDLNLSPIASTPTPPSDAQAAIVGKLTGQAHTFMGAIFDLAERGLLEVREERGFLGAKKYLMVRGGDESALQPFEQGLMAAVFKPLETEVKMDQVSTRFGSKKQLFEDPLDQDLTERGWLDPQRQRTRRVLLALGVAVMILSIVGFCASLLFGGISLGGDPLWTGLAAAIIGICAALFILSIPFLLYAATFSPLTPSGEEQSARWKGFGQYLKDVSKGREPAIRPDFFELYLPYAAVFGLGEKWARYFQKLGGAPLPIWFHAAAGGEADFTSMIWVMSASDTSGSGGGAGGGAGASGGGSSGAG